MSKLTPFHIAIAVRDLAEAKEFYHHKLGFKMGRSDSNWIDFNMFGHQFVAHLDKNLGKSGKAKSVHNNVDSYQVPVPHFGVILEFEDWHIFAEKLSNVVDFIIKPYIRFEGKSGEQGTMFFADPSGNHLEFKAFKNIEEELFKT